MPYVCCIQRMIISWSAPIIWCESRERERIVNAVWKRASGNVRLTGVSIIPESEAYLGAWKGACTVSLELTAIWTAWSARPALWRKSWTVIRFLQGKPSPCIILWEAQKMRPGFLEGKRKRRNMSSILAALRKKRGYGRYWMPAGSCRRFLLFSREAAPWRQK